MTNHCPRCGARLRADAPWCGQCHADLRGLPTTAQASGSVFDTGEKHPWGSVWGEARRAADAAEAAGADAAGGATALADGAQPVRVDAPQAAGRAAPAGAGRAAPVVSGRPAPGIGAVRPAAGPEQVEAIAAHWAERLAATERGAGLPAMASAATTSGGRTGLAIGLGVGVVCGLLLLMALLGAFLG